MASRVGTAETMGEANAEAGHAQAHDAFAGQVVYQILGTWSGTITWYATQDGGTTDFAIRAEQLGTGTLATTTTTNGIFRIDASGLIDVFAKMTSYSSGTATLVPTWVIG